jgi:sterol desaturase/sphingolipid hydroxylase (fatty acid hydroxylase superfamily)
MPTPLELLQDPFTLALLAAFAALALWERLAPGRPLARVPGWTARALLSFAVYFLLSSYLPLLWADTLAPLQLADLSRWPAWAAVPAAVLAVEAASYALHRALHRYTPLWRLCHQMHHSAERVDAVGAFWFSPWDMVAFTLAASLALVVVGVSAQAATWALLIITWLTIFQHANVRTPRGLGWLVQRPEMHALHHARGIHHFNYAELPLFDLAFGTFRNPGGYEHETGFWQGASARVLDMLLLRDVAEGAAEGRHGGVTVAAHTAETPR